jgi:hypothetical protein
VCGKTGRGKNARAFVVEEQQKSSTVTRDQWKEWNDTHKARPCPHPNCKNGSTMLIPDARGDLHIFCKQCGRTDGKEPPGAEKPGHMHVWRPIPGGEERCDDCAEQQPIGGGSRPAFTGMSRAQYNANRRNHFGTFG